MVIALVTRLLPVYSCPVTAIKCGAISTSSSLCDIYCFNIDKFGNAKM